MAITEPPTSPIRPSEAVRQNKFAEASRLSHRLESLEIQLERLTNLLSEQAATKNRRRRQLTIRMLLLSVALFAVFFTWFGNHYHRSRKQAAAVDRLIAHNAFVMYSPRESTLVSLMPGDPQQPPASLASSFGDDFFRAATNVSTAALRASEDDKPAILDALSSLDRLQRLRLTNLPLRTTDLAQLESLTELQSLDISRTGLDYGAMPWLRTMPLRWFDASHTRLSDRALYDLSHCRELQQLVLERSAVTDAGLKYLSNLEALRYLNLKRCPVSLTAVKQLSTALPGCVIDYEPLRFLPDGRVDGRAARGGRVRFGNPAVPDPRESRRALPPVDGATVSANANLRQWQVIPYRGIGTQAY